MHCTPGVILALRDAKLVPIFSNVRILCNLTVSDSIFSGRFVTHSSLIDEGHSNSFS